MTHSLHSLMSPIAYFQAAQEAKLLRDLEQNTLGLESKLNPLSDETPRIKISSLRQQNWDNQIAYKRGLTK